MPARLTTGTCPACPAATANPKLRSAQVSVVYLSQWGVTLRFLTCGSCSPIRYHRYFVAAAVEVAALAVPEHLLDACHRGDRNRLVRDVRRFHAGHRMVLDRLLSYQPVEPRAQRTAIVVRIARTGCCDAVGDPPLAVVRFVVFGLGRNGSEPRLGVVCFGRCDRVGEPDAEEAHGVAVAADRAGTLGLGLE